jgi:hypothetical protein
VSFARAAFNLSTLAISGVTAASANIAAVADGWYRCTIVFAATGTTTVASVLLGGSFVAGQGHYFWGAQLELGSRASSPILTFGATATRAADALVVPDSGWLDATKGTYVVDFVPAVGSTGVNRNLFAHDDGTAYASGSGMLARISTAGRFEAGGNSSATLTANAVVEGAINRAAVVYQAGVSPHLASVLNGGSVSTIDSDYTGAGVARLRVGTGPNGALNGHIGRIRCTRRVLSNAQATALTV